MKLGKVWLVLLLSHHPPSQVTRTIWVPLGFGMGVRTCARCTGQIVGLIVGLFCVAHWCPSPLLAVVGGLLPLPAIIDWTTQALDLRESHNALRLASGAMFALGFCAAGRVLFGGHLFAGLAALTALALAAGVALGILARSGAIDRLVSDLDAEAELLGLYAPGGDPAGILMQKPR